MQVILRADVENLGHLGDVVNVKPGYGRNYLLPQGMAMTASPSNLKTFELERRKLQEKMDALRKVASDIASQLAKAALVITMRVGENDKLYGSVTSVLIAEALAAKGIELDRRNILLDAPIRTLGEHHVRARLHADVIADFTVTVAAEERHIEEAAPQAPVKPESDAAAEALAE